MVKQPVELLVYWTSVLKELQHLERAIQSVWQSSLMKLRQAPRRWLKVHGHIDAVIATLIDLGWNPELPTQWVDDSGDTGGTWSLDSNAQDVGTRYDCHFGTECREKGLGHGG